MVRLLGTIDDWVTENGLEGEFVAPDRFAPTRVEESPPLTLIELRWRDFLGPLGDRLLPDYSWLQPGSSTEGPSATRRGVVTDAPGLYRIGLNLLRRRKSSFIHGAEDDARTSPTSCCLCGVGAPV